MQTLTGVTAPTALTSVGFWLGEEGGGLPRSLRLPSGIAVYLLRSRFHKAENVNRKNETVNGGAERCDCFSESSSDAF